LSWPVWWFLFQVLERLVECSHQLLEPWSSAVLRSLMPSHG
jgi:hypothetical protein